jgi:hypothetical protein
LAPSSTGSSTYSWLNASETRATPVSVTSQYRESPQSGNAGSRGSTAAVTVQPSGSNTRATNAGPAATTGRRSVNGIAVPASSGRSLEAPRIAVRKTCPIAPASSEVAVYGRSLTYCESEKSAESRLRLLIRPIGSISTYNAAVHRCSVASG